MEVVVKEAVGGNMSRAANARAIIWMTGKRNLDAWCIHPRALVLYARKYRIQSPGGGVLAKSWIASHVLMKIAINFNTLM